ncbi:monocarboxylate transporter 12-like [Amphiura filiformis]|uniref:monocarboxylate transporter 12-like n=1 Tax=Amphiura filiformis TaxID=82378 RepID=UPI003B221A14
MALGLIIASSVSHPILVHFSMTVLGVGRGLPMISKIVIIRKYFNKDNFNKANGFASAGGSLGLFLLPPLIEGLNHMYGWRGGLLIFGALCLNSGFAGFLMKEGNKDKENIDPVENLEDEEQHSEVNEKRCSVSCKNIWEMFGFATLKRHPSFVIELITFTLLDLALYGWFFFLFTFLTSNGVSYKIASIVSAIGGAGSLFGRLVFGPLLDKILSARRLIAISALIASVTLTMYPFDFFEISYWWWGGLTFLTGIFAGTTTPIYTALIEEKFPDNKSDFASAVGLHYMMRGVGILCGGPLTGFIYDKTGNFDLAFFVLAGFQATGGALVCLELFLKREHCLYDLEKTSTASESEIERLK